MHMADALISPATGGIMWVAAAAMTTYSVKNLNKNFSEGFELNDKKIPLMGVMGAFVFASQMINFTIPGTGSSGHIGGGMLLAALLGPYAGFLTMACILAIQSLFFADGGLLALGCNIFNLGFYTCFLAYPLIYRKIVSKGISKKSIFTASMLSVIVGLQLGAFSVVLQTVLSGKTELPFGAFVMLMQPIHLAIGIVEGLITSAVLVFLWNARPEILESAEFSREKASVSYKKVLISLLCVTVLVGGVISWFASSHPDGLEWSIEKIASSAELNGAGSVHEFLKRIQEKTSFLPDYGFNTAADQIESNSSVSAGTSVSGLVGSLITLGLAGLIGITAKKYYKRKVNAEHN